MSGDKSLLYCYNKGCGKKFNPTENGPESCLYHPGPPYFHDAYKIWNCCNKKSTDFGTWLSFVGCTKGMHNGEKPNVDDSAKPIKSESKIRPEAPEEVIVWNGLNKPAFRDDRPRIMQNLEVNISDGVVKAIEAFEHASLNSRNDVVQIGSPCRNSGCNQVYEGLMSDEKTCIYHSGTAVFHEGMKFWSCCEKKTTDFGAFMEQKGCTAGKHNWSKIEIDAKIREDWFCRSGFVHLNIYCKGVMPDKCSVKCDGLVLLLKIVHGFGTKETEKKYELFDAIEVGESKVNFGERKIELVLKQKCSGDKPSNWPRLIYDPVIDAVEN
ncbi:unnamed protein product [Dracunculus medinensis]|uniref:CHORD domain-containing protein n=1 Tax=Dracunculus medinensis TaxID=318479 RepID=A0A0N4U2I5_DRAME|nr:unnamed protein product [Dracunculus medinensis]